MYFAPLIFARHGVFVLLAQEADLVGLDQGVDVGREGVELLVIELDGAGVLLAALHGLELAVALKLLDDPGHGDGEREGDEEDQEDAPDEAKALLGLGYGAAVGGGAGHEGPLPWKGSVWVLL